MNVKISFGSIVYFLRTFEKALCDTEAFMKNFANPNFHCFSLLVFSFVVLDFLKPQLEDQNKLEIKKVLVV